MSRRSTTGAARVAGAGRRTAGLLASLLLAAAAAAPPARAGDEPLRPYEAASDLLATTPSTDDGAIGALYNPAQWGVLERPEFSFFWSDANAAPHRLDNWGFAAGRGLGVSMRRIEERAPAGVRRVVDWQVGTGAGGGAHYGGVALGFSGPGKGEFGRASYLALGEIARPTRWLSCGTSGQFALGNRAIQGVADVGVRPLSDPRLLLFADYALRRDQRWDGGALAAGVAARPLPGLAASLRWGKDDRLQVTVGLTLDRSSFRATPNYDRHGNRGATQYVIRADAPTPGFDLDARMHRGRRTMALDLNGRAVYQSYRFFDEDALPLRDLIDRLDFAEKDPTVGGVAIHLSGFRGNLEMAWEIRAKLLEIREAGKRVAVACDDLTGPTLLIAAAADRLVMDPQAAMILPGVQISRTYLHDLLHKLGLGFEEWRFYKYKSAMETLARDRMSDADREQWDAIARAEYDEIARAFVASGRATREEFDRVVNEEPYATSTRLLELHWVDRLGRWEDLEDWIAEDGPGGKPRKAAAIEERRWRPNPTWGRVPTIALVYLVGDCAMDEGIHAGVVRGASPRCGRIPASTPSCSASTLPAATPWPRTWWPTRRAGSAKRRSRSSSRRAASPGAGATGSAWTAIGSRPRPLRSPARSASSEAGSGTTASAGSRASRPTGSRWEERRPPRRAHDPVPGRHPPRTKPGRGREASYREELRDDVRPVHTSGGRGPWPHAGARARAGGGPRLRRPRRRGRGARGSCPVARSDDPRGEAPRGHPPGARVRVTEYPRRPLFRLPAFLGGGARARTRAVFPGVPTRRACSRTSWIGPDVRSCSCPARSFRPRRRPSASATRRGAEGSSA